MSVHRFAFCICSLSHCSTVVLIDKVDLFEIR